MLAAVLHRSPLFICRFATAVFKDLLALEQEFSELQFDRKQKQLSVITRDIELERVQLGGFKIVLNLNALSIENAASYWVVAINANPAQSSHETTHPHVDSERFCEGDAQPTIRLALKQGRLLDFFQIVEQFLMNYNPSSAYVQIEDWECVRGRSSCTCVTTEILRSVSTDQGSVS